MQHKQIAESGRKCFDLVKFCFKHVNEDKDIKSAKKNKGMYNNTTYYSKLSRFSL